ncbi:MAG: pyridoxal phosphate-dependent aminotransferase [Kiritimatiellae bacterium]|nr:pyridoxal phosphate-dependent aminotransferase [Kiritimatiellia bacterium]
MRKKIFNPKTAFLQYGIREVVELAQQLGEADPQFKFVGENIGDPVAKKWQVPVFVKKILADIVRNDNKIFGYAHSRGMLQSRQWVADCAKKLAPSSRLDAEHVLFTNGLGAAISLFYRTLRPGTRIIQPHPGYPCHISNEKFAAGQPSIGYRADPDNNWAPDLEHLESQIKKHPEIAGILLINPNNPTGAVYNQDTLERVVQLAGRHRLMLISDEVYFRLVFNKTKYVHLTELAARRVPLIVMRGMSKDIPWPGGRCGWLEFHNSGLDRDFDLFFESMKKPLLLEVCAAALPQAAAPLIYESPHYARWLRQYTAELEQISNDIAGMLGKIPGIKVRPIQGAFYLMALFEKGLLNRRQKLPVKNARAAAIIRRLTADPGCPPDKRFAYYTLASTGICVVPASDFSSPFPGFRVTTLDRVSARRRQIYQRLAQAIRDYLASA